MTATKMQLLKCVLGFHEWKKRESKPVEGKYSATLGGYMFNPSTRTEYECSIYKKIGVNIVDFKGDVVREDVPI